MAINILSKVMSKLLRHGFPEIKKIHLEILDFMGSDGFIPLYIILNILNGNNNIGEPVRKKINKNKIDVSDIETMIEEDDRSRYSIKENDNRLLIRANYGHSISKN